MDGTCGNELEIAEFGLQLGSFGVQRVATRGHAIVVGPSDVVGVGVLDRGTPARSVALIEDLEKVGVHQFSDRGGGSEGLLLHEASICVDEDWV